MKQRAFTLIELLVVIAIIAILAAILFPVFAQAKLAAKKAVHISNMKQVGTSLFLYQGDADDTLPQAPCNQGDYACGDDFAQRTSWRYRVQPYLKQKDLFVPPGDTYPGSFNPTTVLVFADRFRQEALAGVRPGMAGSHTWTNNDYYGRNGLSITQVSRPASIMMLTPSRFEFADLGPWVLNGNFFKDAYPGKGPMQTYTGKANYTMMDSHVMSKNPCATFGALKWEPGDEPTDDFMWEWFAKLPSNGNNQDVNLLRTWAAGCRTTKEYQ